ncbi:MAG: O-antigen ligase family protein, partial [Waterburya sp.]
GLIVFSVFWSENPLVTVKAAFALLFFSIFAVHFARKYNWQELSKILRWNCTFIAIYSIFSALFVPSIGICKKGWCGGFGHPIDLGCLMALGVSLWLLHAFSNSKYRLRSLLLSILCLNVMQFTNSAGALLVFVTLITIVLTTTFLKKLNFTQSFIFFILLLFLFGITSIWLIENFENLLSFLNKDITLTGRLPLWTMLIQMRIKERLWLGYGYNAFWQRWRGNDSPAADVVNVIIGDGRDWVAHAHNGYLDIILNIGLIGLVIFVILFFINVIQTIRLIMSNKSPETFLPLIILTFVFMTNLSNSPIIIPSFIWFLFVTITIRLNLVSPKMVS